jgi:hypothetical protein
MVDKEKEPTEIQESASPLMLAAELVQKDGNMDVEKLSKLLEIQERFDANQAKKAYHKAMSDFKENPPTIVKDRHVSYNTSKGNTDYDHATLGNVTACINKALSEHGLTASWVTSQDNESIKVTCKITHVLGHSEETAISAPPDTTGSKNAIQAIGSTITYLQRYTLLSLTGLAADDQDNDGGPPKDTQPTPKAKQNEIVNMAWLEFEAKHQEVLREPDFIQFEFDLELFKNAIIRKFGGLPTNKKSIAKILDKIEPSDCLKERE